MKQGLFNTLLMLLTTQAGGPIFLVTFVSGGSNKVEIKQ
jgi:hypothetical protein